MAGAAQPYDHLPFFYSDLFDLGYEAVGDVDSRLDTVAEWAEPNRKGVVAYVDGDGKARGFLLWDAWGKVDDARELIRSGAVVEPSMLRPPRLTHRRGSSQPREEREGENVEEDVTAGNAARRVSLRESDPGYDGLPSPRADSRAVELERDDDHEDAGVDRAARPQEDRDQKGAAIGPRGVRRREHGDAGNAPDPCDGDSGDEEPARASPDERSQGEPCEVDEPVSGRDERRQVVEAIRVHAPNERPDHLPDRCEADDGEGLQPRRLGMYRQKHHEDGRGHETENELARVPDELVDRENGDDGHDDHRERDEREAVHRRIFADASAAVRSRDYVPACMGRYSAHDLASCGTGGLPARPWSSTAPCSKRGSRRIHGACSRGHRRRFRHHLTSSRNRIVCAE